MADVNIRILFSVDGLAGIQAARKETVLLYDAAGKPIPINIDPTPAVQGFKQVEKQAAASGQEVQRFSGRSGVARMAVIGFSQSIQDASMFQQSFRMGMMSIGNNVDMVVQSLTMLSEESKRTGTSMSSSLLNVLKGPSGILVGISILITLLQILPGLFNKAGQAAKEASEQGLKDFSDWLTKLTTGQLGDLKAQLAAQKKSAEEQARILEQSVIWSGAANEAEKKKKNEMMAQAGLLRTQADEYGKQVEKIDAALATRKSQAQIEAEISTYLKDHGTRLQQLSHELDILNSKVDKTQADSDRIDEIHKEIVRLTASTLNLDKLNLDQLEKRQAYEEAILEDHNQSFNAQQRARQTLIDILSLEIPLQKNLKDRLDLQTKLNALLHDQYYVEGKIPVIGVKPGGYTKTGESTSQMAQTGAARMPIYVDMMPDNIAEQERTIQAMQEQLAQATTQAKREELQRQIADHQAALTRMQQGEEAYRDFVVQSYIQQNQGAAIAISGIEAGVMEMGNQFLVVHRQAKSSWDAVWISMENTMIGTITSMLAKEAAYYATEVMMHTGAESAKTAATEAGVGTRLVALAAEVASTLASAAASMVKAVASVISWEVATFGPFALITIPASIAGMYGIFEGAKKMMGLAIGGKVTQETLARLGEGGKTEFVMPEKSFYDVAKAEIIPKVLQIAYSQAVPANAANDNGSLLAEIKTGINDLNKAIGSLQLSTGIKGSDVYIYLKKVNSIEGKYGI